MSEKTPCKFDGNRKCECLEFRPLSRKIMTCYGCGHSIEWHKGAKAKEINNAPKS